MGLIETPSSTSEWESSNNYSLHQARRTTTNLSKRLQDILQINKGYQFIQQNGQRIFELCTSMNLFSPPKGCEIFIGNIPKHVFEDRLIPLFQTVGQLYKFRLMLDFNQKTRGYGFATYFHPEDVTEAIEKLNGYEIGKGVRLGIYKSIDNCRLFVGNVPKDKTREDVYNVFHNCIEGVADVIMYPSWKDKDINRGFAFLEFESHIQASVARRQLHPRNLVVWNQALYVDWADPVPEVDPQIMSQVSVLYVKNLPYEMDSKYTHNFFKGIVGANLIKKTHKMFTYAFVHCKNRRSAEIVMDKLKGLEIDEQKIAIEWARPRQYSTQLRALQPPDNYCLSVPLRTRRLVRQMSHTKRAPAYAASEAAMHSSSFSSSARGSI